MTSAPVKDVGSLLNFVGNRVPQTKNMGAAESFGDVMSKASGNQPDFADIKKPDTVKAQDVRKPDADSSYASEKVSNAQSSVKESKSVKADESAADAVNEAGKEMVKEVADKLGVSEEEVVQAMEQMGLGMADLLNADNLAKLVLTLSGEESSLALLTNEGLYGVVQELLQNLESVKEQLSNDLQMTSEELTQMLEDMKAAKLASNEETQKMLNTGNLEEEVLEEDTPAKITVTVEQTTESVEFVTDENGNVKQVESVVSKEDAFTQNGKEENSNQENQAGKDTLAGNNLMQENLLLNKVQTVETTFEQSALYMSEQTNEIMDQILDYMKIQLKPDMDQLTMQLHPESLGTLHIQITSKGGEVTAQFNVQNEIVKAIIESQIVELKESLKEQGIKVEAVEVAVESHEFESNLWQGQERDENATYQRSKRTPRRININDLMNGFEEEASEEEVLAAKMMEANGNTVDYTA